MGLMTRLATSRNDEREDMITARAAMFGFTAMSLSCIALGIIRMVQGRIGDVMVVVLLLCVGQIVYVGSILRSKATR
jgi:hypothetical protein